MYELLSTTNSNITFNGIEVVNTTISVIKISNSGQSKSINQYITINDLTVHDTNYVASDNLILIEKISSEGVYQISMNRIKMNDLHFTASSNLMKLGHQSNEVLMITDATFTNIVFAGISIGAFDQSLDIVSKVFMNNITANNIDAYFR